MIKAFTILAWTCTRKKPIIMDFGNENTGLICRGMHCARRVWAIARGVKQVLPNISAGFTSKVDSIRNGPVCSALVSVVMGGIDTL